jgi:hypothetical protein
MAGTVNPVSGHHSLIQLVTLYGMFTSTWIARS